MSNLTNVIQELFVDFDKYKENLVKEYFDFLRIPSISSEAQYSGDMRKCCNWLVDFLKKAGMEVEVWETSSRETSGHPVVYASWTKAANDQPTLLFYGHYDVQPVDPLNLWTSPPFEPRLVGDEVYARGAQDNKGQCFYTIAAIRHLLMKNGKLPVNVKLCIEGEEECGSAGLPAVLKTKQEKLKADHLFIVDMGLHDKETPEVTLGVRGIVCFTVELKGSSSDMHSGMVGGVVYNPNRALAELLASLYDSEGRVQVPGFYDDVIELSAEKKSVINFHFDEKNFYAMFKAKPTGGERTKFPPMQRASIRPTLEINGINGGYSGDGFKTVIPAKALAKLSCRLVPNQSSEKIGKLVEDYLKKQVAPGIEITVQVHPGQGDPLVADPDSKTTQAAATVYKEIFKKPCLNSLSGGSIPIVPDLAKASGAEVVLIGYGLADDNIHAPNEHFGLDRLKKGFATIGGIIHCLAK